jgi:hypothetical protein
MHGWDSYFTLTGTAGATLIGLMFIVITLGADIKSSKRSDETLARTFVTPALRHFAVVFFAALLMLVPNPSPWFAVIVLASFGGIGLFYAVKIAAGIRSSRNPDLHHFEWLWHGGLPALGYVAIVAAAAEIAAGAESALPCVAIGSAILLYCGIRNAWAVALTIIGSKRQR